MNDEKCHCGKLLSDSAWFTANCKKNILQYISEVLHADVYERIHNVNEIERFKSSNHYAERAPPVRRNSRDSHTRRKQ
jgi:hypothetical protein